MTKEELIKEIDSAIITEEEAVPIYSKHLQEILIWCKSSSENKDKIIDNIKILIEESKKHKIMFENIKKKILKGDINDIAW